MTSLQSLLTADWATSLWVQAPAALILWVAIFLVVRTVFLRVLRRMAARTPWTWDDVLVQALSTPLLIVILASGLTVFDRILPLEPEWDRAFDILFAFSIALALVLFVDRVVRGVLDRMSDHSPILTGSRGLVQGGIRAIVIGIGLLIFLDSIGISITPILASLGVGSLAVALALQDTLANLFAGIYMIADKPIEPGQMIRLPTGEEGVVTKVGWRSTWIRLQVNSMLVIPNSKLAGGPIINYDLPQPQMAVDVTVGVHFDSDLDKVERVALEVARDLQRTAEAGVTTEEPLVRYIGFGESSIQLTIRLRARDMQSSYLLRHAFVKRLQAKFRKEEIVIPYPTRTLDLPPERAVPEIPGRGQGVE